MRTLGRIWRLKFARKLCFGFGYLPSSSRHNCTLGWLILGFELVGHLFKSHPFDSLVAVNVFDDSNNNLSVCCGV